MKRAVQWLFDDATDTLFAQVEREDGTGSDVVWSTTNTTPPPPWPEPQLPQPE